MVRIMTWWQGRRAPCVVSSPKTAVSWIPEPFCSSSCLGCQLQQCECGDSCLGEERRLLGRFILIWTRRFTPVPMRKVSTTFPDPQLTGASGLKTEWATSFNLLAISYYKLWAIFGVLHYRLEPHCALLLIVGRQLKECIYNQFCLYFFADILPPGWAADWFLFVFQIREIALHHRDVEAGCGTRSQIQWLNHFSLLLDECVSYRVKMQFINMN